MNKIKFNEGGQPFFLDDFELLQDNQDEILNTMVECLCGGGNVIIRGGECTADNEKIYVKSGKAFVNGEIVEWDDLSVDIANVVNDLYLCVKKNDGDKRVFENGTQQYCRENHSVTLSTTKNDAWGYIDVLNPDRFTDKVKSVLGVGSTSPTSWTRVQPHESNTNDVALWFMQSANLVQIKLKIELKLQTWGENDDRTIFYWSMEPLKDSLKGKFSPVILKGNDGCVYSDIIEWNYIDGDGYSHIRLLSNTGEPVTHLPAGSLEGIFYIPRF